MIGKTNVSGGASPLNFSVKDYATEAALLADTPSENTVGIVTTTDISSYSFQNDLPNIFGPVVTPDAYDELLLCGGDLIDYSDNGFSVSNASITQNTSVVKCNSSSMLFNGSAYAQVADNDGLDFGSSDFTIDGWFYFTNNSRGYQTLVDKRTTGADRTGWLFLIENNNTINFLASSGSSWSLQLRSSQVPALNAWVHLAVVRNGTNWTLYYNGSSIATTTNSMTIGNTASPLRVGYENAPPTGYYYGYIDGLRISKGVARWTAAFTPPTNVYTLTQDIQDGVLYIQEDTKSNAADFNSIKSNTNKLMVYPKSAKQVVSSAFSFKKAYTYKSNNWVSWVDTTYLYDNGNEYASLTGGWTNSGYKTINGAAALIAGTKNTDSFYFSGGGSYADYRGFGIAQSIDLTDVATIYAQINVTSTRVFSSESTVYIALSILSDKANSPLSASAAMYRTSSPTLGSQTISVDVSALSGAYYMSIMSYNAAVYVSVIAGRT